jgi:hypothetical protein
MSTYLKAKEDGKRKRAKTREELRIRFAGDALVGLLSTQGYTANNEEDLARDCVGIAEAMVRALGYWYEIKPSPLSDEEKLPLDKEDEI